jgi:hypothetical protein
MTLKMYGLDRYAHDLVAEFCEQGVLNETHDMRKTAAFGLERFFGEHLRLQAKDEKASAYWCKTWDTLVTIMDEAGITVPTLKKGTASNSETIRQVIDDLWNEERLPRANRKVVLAVLIQLCDNMVWWAQRYKKFEPQKSRPVSQVDAGKTVGENANNA